MTRYGIGMARRNHDIRIALRKIIDKFLRRIGRPKHIFKILCRARIIQENTKYPKQSTSIKPGSSKFYI